MTKENYIKELTKAFNCEKNSILSNLNSFLQKIPPEAVRVNIIISPSQDGEGDFCIHGGLNGPDLYVLNKKVEDWTNILEIKHGTDGFKPDFPMVDPFSIDYYVNDLIEKEFVKWYDSNYNEIDDSKVNVGISIYSDHI
tara:strand:+ start:1035 stop:1451 length:417 start_codon:yes stop_codon:yes gene_type:complete